MSTTYKNLRIWMFERY